MKRIGAAAVAAAMAVGGAGEAAAQERAPGRSGDRYIVVFTGATGSPGAKTDRLERSRGFEARYRYRHAVKGFAARLSARQVAALRADPQVASVTPDRPVHALTTTPLTAGDSAPTGLRRIGAATTTAVREASTAAVAVIDSGIDLAHPDLNAADGKNCVSPGAAATDDNGHGTHVAGTIGARNDGHGVAGVAPGTQVLAVKVLDAEGSGMYSQIICGIEWVTATRTDADPANDIAVANMSLGGPGAPIAPCATTTDPMHRAICASTAAGVTYVVAAGNDGWDFDYAPAPDTPAAYPEVLTVSAASDSDGTSGAAGPAPSCRTGEADDRYATFSNFAATSAGAAHTVAAAGVCIRSTWPGGLYNTISGTSMAAPHVAGAVALCLGEAGRTGPCTGLTPAQIAAKMRSDAQGRTTALPSYGFAGDPTRPLSGRYYGYLAWTPAPPAPDTTAPAATAVSPASGAAGVATGSAVSVTFSEPMDRASAERAFSLRRAADGAGVAGAFSWSGNTLTFRPSSALAAYTSYTAAVDTTARDVAGNALAAGIGSTFRTLGTFTAAPGATVLESGSVRSGTYTRLAANDNVFYDVSSTTSGTTRTSSWYGRFTAVPRALRSLRVAYSGRASATCSQTVSIWRWTTSAWLQLDARSVGTTEALADRAVTGTPTDYVSSTGEVRVRVRCTRTASFYAGGDQLRITYTR